MLNPKGMNAVGAFPIRIRHSELPAKDLTMWIKSVGVACLVVACGLVGNLRAQSHITVVDAIKSGDTQVIRALVKEKAAVNTPEKDGTTALHWAVRGDNMTAVQLLLRAGAKVNAANRYGVTPLSLAAVNGNAAMIEVLLKAGADPNTTLTQG